MDSATIASSWKPGNLFEILDVVHPRDTLPDSLEIRERTTQPALVHIELPRCLRGFPDGFLRLLLATDKKNLPALCSHARQKLTRALKLPYGFPRD